jgi:hypothetical protein
MWATPYFSFGLMEIEMASDAPSFLVNKLTAIVFIVLGFLILASGYRYGSPSSLIGGCVLLVIGVILLCLKIARRNRSDSAG